MFVYRSSKNKKRMKKDIEPQEIFIDNLAKEHEKEIGVSEKRIEVPISKKSITFFTFFIFSLFCLLFFKSFHIQIIEGSYFSSVAQRNKSAAFSVQSLRGVVYDRNMNQMVFNSPKFDLQFDKNNISTDKNIGEIEDVSRILGITKNEIIELINNSLENIVTIKEDLGHTELVLLTARVDDMSGFSIAKSLDREYLDSTTFAHIMGYIGKVTREQMEDNPEKYSINDYAGVAGIEKVYEDYLSRDKGEVFIKRDVSGNIKSREVVSLPEPGNNLVLWIDYELQKKIEEETLNILEKLGSTSAAVVAIDPNTGGILSMVSIPSYDNHIFGSKADKTIVSDILSGEEGSSFLNRTMSSAYPPGSSIKPLLGAAALQEGVISPDKKIYSPGYITVPNPWNPSQPSIFKDNKAHGWTNLKEAIAVSSNVYFYSIGGGYEDQQGLGIDKIKQYLQLFGWGDETGIDLPSENSGFIPDKQWKAENVGVVWTVGDTYNTSVGQGYLSVTPIQVAMSYASIINGGKLLSPKILKEVRNSNEEVIEKYSSEIIREGFISDKNLSYVKEGMYQTTQIGTALSLGTLDVKMGAKTGTAQTSKPEYYHNWITVFAPFEEPEILITIIIEEVEGIRPATIPLARNILEWYFNEYLK